MSRRAILSATAALAALVSVAWQPAQAMTASTLLPGDPVLVNLVSSEQALVDLTNADRAANGVAPLQVDPDTVAIARQRAESQLGTQSLAHYDASGQLVFAQLLASDGVRYDLAGENLARASVDDTNIAERVEQALMGSPLHRKNILEPTFTRVAIGAATDSSGEIAFAEIYRD